MTWLLSWLGNGNAVIDSALRAFDSLAGCLETAAKLNRERIAATYERISSDYDECDELHHYASRAESFAARLRSLA